jgi:hypothetical protein
MLYHSLSQPLNFYSIFGFGSIYNFYVYFTRALRLSSLLSLSIAFVHADCLANTTPALSASAKRATPTWILSFFAKSYRAIASATNLVCSSRLVTVTVSFCPIHTGSDGTLPAKSTNQRVRTCTRLARAVPTQSYYCPHRFPSHHHYHFHNFRRLNHRISRGPF